MKISLTIFLLLISIFSFSEPWELKKDKEGIKVYTRKTSLSSFKEYKGVTYIKTDRRNVVLMVLEIEEYVNWFPDCLESKLIKKEGAGEYIVYYKIDTPWPSSNRDACIKLNLERDDANNTTTINFKDAINYKSEVNGVVRVKNTSGYWKFIQEGSRTKVIYQCLTDPGGSIPAWIANLFVVDAPFDTLKAMKKKLE
ncbi:START domain-containing protein [Paracrocinitomix mangrovi]|uniref:START domain-containing protein n=1 Tax=Paracrocinitomix mangrovi TaxID=2862509 RepID=UPI001C8E2B1F|nr:START domain-containing protein [Paracrocinitomix mangrovi]UKN03700.1 START domain-containing protein [Paracrocinitomix mangrovi]